MNTDQINPVYQTCPTCPEQRHGYEKCESFIVACVRDHVDCYIYFSKNKNIETPLCYAVCSGAIYNIMTYLLKNNLCDINEQTKDEHETALHIACYRTSTLKDVNIIELLLIHGADQYIRDIYNLTPRERLEIEHIHNKKYFDIIIELFDKYSTLDIKEPEYY